MPFGRMSPHLIPTTDEAFVILGGFDQEAAAEVQTPLLFSVKPVEEVVEVEVEEEDEEGEEEEEEDKEEEEDNEEEEDEEEEEKVEKDDAFARNRNRVKLNRLDLSYPNKKFILLLISSHPN